jgi:hypothetical protein
MLASPRSGVGYGDLSHGANPSRIAETQPGAQIAPNASGEEVMSG